MKINKDNQVEEEKTDSIKSNSLAINGFEFNNYYDFPKFIIPDRDNSMNNKQKSNENYSIKMIKWAKEYIEELKKLTAKELPDSQISRILSQKFGKRFTSLSVKRKRHRLKLIKKQKTVIDNKHFYIKTCKKSTGKGFGSSYFPLSLINKYNITDQDFLIFRKNKSLFISKIKEIKRKDRPNKIIEFIQKKTCASTAQIVRSVNVSRSKAHRKLTFLKSKGYICTDGRVAPNRSYLWKLEEVKKREE